jgi:diguanylate cyclase (GGDEF)-like protein
VLAIRCLSRIKKSLSGVFRWTWYGLGLLNLVWVPVVLSAQEPVELPPIRSAGAAHGLSAAEAARGRLIDLKANVVFYTSDDGPWGAMLFVSDASGGVFVRLVKQPSVPLREGQLVEVTGVSAPGEFTAMVSSAEVRLLDGTSVAVEPVRLTRADLVTGRFDCRPVEVQGLVHAVGENGKSVWLRIATDEGPIAALLVRQPGVDYHKYEDAAVLVRGVVAPDFNAHRQMTGVHLFVQSADDISTLALGGSDPFASEVRPIGELGFFDPTASPLHRLHFQGRATLNWPGRMVCLQDASGGLCVASASTEKIAVGSTIDMAGYPVFAVAIPTVEDAVVRTSGMAANVSTFPMPVAQPVKVQAVLKGEYSGDLVSVEGQLVGVNSDTRNWQLTLTSDGVFYTGTVPKEGALQASSPWLTGSYVRLVGVCLQDEDVLTESGRVWVSDQRFQSFRILMRTEADVTILRTPSWWTPGRAVLVLSLTLVLTIAGFGWVILLRRRVDERTQELRASEERYRNLAQHDALTGAPNRALFQDRAHMALLQAKRNGQRCGLLLLDMDRFKPINDELGHAAGDRVLCALVDRAGGAVRKSDTVARIGGDEFAVLVPDLDSPEEALMIAHKILNAVCLPLKVNDREIPVSTSLGVAVYPDDGTTVEELLRNADSAMYRSKRSGRGTVERYEREHGADESNQ